MRKLLLTLAAATLTMSAFATLNVSRKSNAAVTPGIPSQSTQKFGSLMSSPVIERAKMAKASAMTRAEEGEANVITEAPEGKVETMLGSSNTFYLYYDEVSMDETYGIAYEGVWTDNGEVYLKNPISMLDWDTYIKGKVTDEGLLFEFPQPLYTSTDEDGSFTLFVDVLEYAEIESPDDPDEYYTTFIPAEETRSILFAKMEDGSYGMEDDYMLGVTFEGAWQGYGEMYLNVLPFEATPAKIPEGIKYDYTYILADEFTGWDHTVLRPIGIGELDGTTYIKGLASGMPDAVIYGEFDKEKNTLTIPSDQFLGKYYNHYIFMMAGVGLSWYNEDWDEVMYSFDIVEDPLVLNYDPETNVFRPVITEGYDYSYVIFNFGNVETYPCEYYAIDRIYSQGQITDYAPLAPEVIAVSDIEFMDPSYSYSIEFNIFGDNKDGQILLDNNIYYNIFINGELYTFTSEEYPDLGELGITEITDIPVFLSTDEDIYSYGNYHGIAFKRKDIETIGIRALYIDGDIRGESEIVTVNTEGELVSVDSIVSNSVSKNEMFDLSGRRIASGARNGIFIKRTTMEDGSVRTEKVIRK
ncbi:MAG: hypothetical protein K2K75_07170 [Muribaculaceae bacterium]|nr:hypothetical protein [Muribaculaceae bacterium]